MEVEQEFMRDMPYAAYVNHSDKTIWFVNRHYKSLGSESNQWVAYPEETKSMVLVPFYSSGHFPLTSNDEMQQYKRALEPYRNYKVLADADTGEIRGIPKSRSPPH